MVQRSLKFLSLLSLRTEKLVIFIFAYILQVIHCSNTILTIIDWEAENTSNKVSWVVKDKLAC